MNQNCNCEIHKTSGESQMAEMQRPVQPTPEQPKAELPRPFKEILGALRYASRAMTEPNGEIYSREVLNAAAEAMNCELDTYNAAFKSNAIRLVVTEKIYKHGDETIYPQGMAVEPLSS